MIEADKHHVTKGWWEVDAMLFSLQGIQFVDVHDNLWKSRQSQFYNYNTQGRVRLISAKHARLVWV